MTTLPRRTLITGGTALALAGLGISRAVPAYAELKANPFTLGVASGDPNSNSVVLWTRLALDPVAPDGLGGMGSKPVDVEWQLASDEHFTRVVKRGTARASVDFGHSVHVEVSGLVAGADYFYRFRTGGYLSPTGRTRTTPSAHSLTSPLSMAVTSCAQWEHGFFTAYRRAAQDQPQLILQLGDYLYEHGPLGYPVGHRARSMVGGETFTLADYRRRHALYKTDPDLQFAHATAPWLVVFDDHEVDNDWAGPNHEVFGTTREFARRRAAAFQAYWENMPLRLSAMPRGGSMSLHRRIDWGALASLHMLDTRQYRSDQPCGGLIGPCSGSYSTGQTMLGSAQEQWLADALRTRKPVWDIFGQQVMFAQYDIDPGPAFITNMDAWDGYVAAKARMLDLWQNTATRNPVVLTGDVHEHFAHDLDRATEAGTQTVGAEFVTSSISSGGDKTATPFTTDPQNPHMKYHANVRGYLNCRVSKDEFRTDYRAVDRVSTPGSPAHTVASFILADGQRGLASAT